MLSPFPCPMEVRYSPYTLPLEIFQLLRKNQYPFTLTVTLTIQSKTLKRNSERLNMLKAKKLYRKGYTTKYRKNRPYRNANSFCKILWIGDIDISPYWRQYHREK